MPCQNRATFSRSGVVVVAMRYSQFSPEPSVPIMPDSSGWNRRIRSSPMRRSVVWSSSISTVAS